MAWANMLWLAYTHNAHTHSPPDVELIEGRGRIVDEHTVDVDGKRYTVSQFVCDCFVCVVCVFLCADGCC